MTVLDHDTRRAIEWDCAALMHRYAVNADHHVERFSEVFADDAEWIRPGARLRGRAAIQAHIDGLHGQRERDNPHGHVTRHLVTTVSIEAADADHAAGVIYALVFRDEQFRGTLPVAMNTIELLVEYQTRFVRRSGRWQIARHEAVPVFRR